jgi:hypothetical protein
MANSSAGGLLGEGSDETAEIFECEPSDGATRIHAYDHLIVPVEPEVGLGVQRITVSVGQFLPGSDLVQIASAKTVIAPALSSLIRAATSSSEQRDPMRMADLSTSSSWRAATSPVQRLSG